MANRERMWGEGELGGAEGLLFWRFDFVDCNS